MNGIRLGLLIGLVSVAAWSAEDAPPLPKDQPVVKGGNLELGLFGGESYGLDRFRPMGGANIAYGLSPALFPFAEASYLPGVLRTVNIPTGTTTSYQQFNVNMMDFHAGLHIRVPKPESPVVPYAVVGLGMIRQSQSTSTAYLVTNFGTVPFSANMPSTVNFSLDFGAGLRFFFNERFALRLEFKAFKPIGANAVVANGVSTPVPSTVVYRFAIGPVFQLR